MFKKRYILYSLIALFLFSLCLNYDIETFNGGSNILAVDYLEKGNVIEETLIPKYNNMTRLGIKFTTHLKEDNQGTINIKIVSKLDDKTIYDYDIQVSEIVDNKYYFFDFDLQKHSKNKEYVIIINVKKLSNDSLLGLWGYNITKQSMKIDDVETGKNFTIAYNGKGINQNLLLYPILFILIVALSEMVKNNEQEEKVEYVRKNKKHKIKK